MAPDSGRGKLYPMFTIWRQSRPARETGIIGEMKRMNALAIALFVMLFAFGQNYFGWDDPHGKVQLALFATFVLGIVSGYKTRG
jgi:hypothetical protein